MAGTPRRTALEKELRRLAVAAEIESPTPCLDYTCLRLESGDTLFDLCGELALVVGGRVYAGSVQRLLADEAGGNEAVSRRLTEARKRGAFALAEDGKYVVDAAQETPAAVAKSRAQLDARMKLAECYNRETFGSKSNPTLSISIGELHLAALRAANSEAKALARVNAQLTPTVEAEIVDE